MYIIHFEEKNEKSLSNVLWPTSQIRRLVTGNDHKDHKNTHVALFKFTHGKMLPTLKIIYIYNYVLNRLLLHVVPSHPPVNFSKQICSITTYK